MFKEEFVQFYPQPKSWASSKFKSALIDISIQAQIFDQAKHVIISKVLISSILNEKSIGNF